MGWIVGCATGGMFSAVRSVHRCAVLTTSRFGLQIPSAPNVAAVRLTSKTKPHRSRWEVPVSGGYVVVGDIYSLAMSDIEQKPPRAKYPARLTNDESAAIAVKQKSSLSLS